MSAFRVGSWTFPFGLSVVGVGAAVAALDDFEVAGVALMVAGGVLALIGFVVFVVGLSSHMQQTKEAQDRTEDRERGREARDTERLEIERRSLEAQIRRLDAEAKLATASTFEQMTTAKASTETVLAEEQQALIAERVTKEHWLKVAKDCQDSARTQVLETELEINRLRMAAIERDVEKIKALVPTEAQRKHEAVQAINDELRTFS